MCLLRRCVLPLQARKSPLRFPGCALSDRGARPHAQGSLTPLRWEASYRVADFVHGTDGAIRAGTSLRLPPTRRSLSQQLGRAPETAHNESLRLTVASRTFYRAGLGNTGLSNPKTSPCGRSAAQLIVELAKQFPGEARTSPLAASAIANAFVMNRSSLGPPSVELLSQPLLTPLRLPG